MAGSRSVSHSLNPIVQGITLVDTRQLPDRLRPIFARFPLFNAIQSKCFYTVYNTDENLVLSAPTGSGKTVIFELAICRLISHHPNHDFKVVYQAPTKALCSERQRDWQSKFGICNITCAELTGDTEYYQLRNVRDAQIIVTTPEKWDSITRKWKDHQRLMSLVKLFLIDEVHVLKEDRGACLEAVVSRMKTITLDIRFIALSATIPNSDDIATWLGKSNRESYLPAVNEVFGETFRPVKLDKYVCGYQANSNNDFAFDKVLNGQLMEVIRKHSIGKPILIFCSTRKQTEDTAKSLAHAWKTAPKCWVTLGHHREIGDQILQECLKCGVAYHHAGVELKDRKSIETAFLEGDIKVICCTSTLAVGVNLPCHFVIVKNTVSYVTEIGSMKEYSDLEMMQMLGRAGRPQFDNSAVAVIMTRSEKVKRYEKLVSGQEVIESRLHLNLLDHINAEVGLGTIHDSSSAQKWLEGTFLHVRLRKNPKHYKLLDEIELICEKDLTLLRECSLINGDESFEPTEFGIIMSRYAVHFGTMKLIMGLQPKAKISEILSAIAQADEFKAIRFKSSEKAMYKAINMESSLKFPIKVDVALPSHKVSILIQSVLGGLDIKHDNRYATNHQQFAVDEKLVFQHANRLVRAIIDCQLYLKDSVGARNGLDLARSLGAQVWDDSPLQLIQIQGIGPVAARKLVCAGIKSIDELESMESQKIDMLLSRNPPFGIQLLTKLRDFPKLRVSLNRQKTLKYNTADGVLVYVKAELGFLNETPPKTFGKKRIWVYLLAEVSNGGLVHFCRMNGDQLGNGQEITFSALLTNGQQQINCYVACEDIAGTLRFASLKPCIPPSDFPSLIKISTQPGSTRRNTQGLETQYGIGTQSPQRDEFDDLDDADLLDLATNDDGYHTEARTKTPWTPERTSKENTGDIEPVRLSNGKWECLHSCKNKNTCRHLCCNEGVDKPPRSRPKEPRQPDKKDSRRLIEMNGFSKQSKPERQGSTNVADLYDNKISPFVFTSRLSTSEPNEGATRFLNTSSSSDKENVEQIDLTGDVIKRPYSSLELASQNANKGLDKKPRMLYSTSATQTVTMIQPEKINQGLVYEKFGNDLLEDNLDEPMFGLREHMGLEKVTSQQAGQANSSLSALSTQPLTPQVSPKDEIQEWMRKEFGDIVEFV